MLAIFKYIEAVARSPKVVLITGETGTGKELIARAVHAASGRPGELLAVNTAELDDAMFSDALFGHKKGSYTGAEERRKGLVETAGSGSLFLDEIGDLGPRAQMKLLRLLESGEYLPIGADVPSVTDVRVIAATNRDLEAAVAAGTFRRDLFFRLTVHRVRLPPLRERMDDLPLLFDHFLAKAASELGLPEPPSYPPRLLERMAAYDFPGNVRELEAMVFDAASRRSGRCLDTRTFTGLAALRSAKRGAAPRQVPVPFATEFPATLPSARALLDKLYATALERTGGSQSAAARLIGVSQQTLSNWMRRQRSEDAGDS
jgi:DNA-binding NtrC family response regulator